MSKSTRFYITNYRDFYDFASSPIRTKADLIHLLLLTMKMVATGTSPINENKGECIIEIDKSSRVYFSLKDEMGVDIKHFSFIFPFSLQMIDERWAIKNKNSEEITSELIEFLIGLVKIGWFNDFNDNSHDLDSFACEFIDVFNEDDSLLKVQYLEIHLWSIIKTLLTFEPGYLRYDYDPTPDRVDASSHPLHHLDIYFSSSGTFKLGFDEHFRIDNRLDFLKFIDILENGKSRNNTCYRLSNRSEFKI